MRALSCVLKTNPNIVQTIMDSSNMKDEWDSQNQSETEIEDYFMDNFIVWIFTLDEDW